ncbi:MAG: DUF1018 domain-containing protein [Desulfobacteraceae bacterium]|nr:MAG: DUF1018 domain-containing protein [Desulfobacteraceae bacterium]
MPIKKIKSASEIYKQQNKILHYAFNQIGIPYNLNKKYWANLFSKALNSNVEGLSGLSLHERNLAIAHLRKLGLKLLNPAIPEDLRAWRKGEKDISFEIREEKNPQIRMIKALWVELGYEPSKITGLVKRMFKIDDIRWLSQEQLSSLLNTIKYKLNRQNVKISYYR